MNNRMHRFAGQSRDLFIDTLRGIAIFGVVCIHFGGGFVTPAHAWTPSFYVGLALNQFFSFSVPLFVFLAGLFVAADKQVQSNYLAYCKKRLAKVGWPYLIASFAAFFWLGVRNEFRAFDATIERIFWSFSHLFYYGTHPIFYFIPMIIMLYFLAPIFLWIAPYFHKVINKKTSFTISQPTLMLIILSLFLLLHSVMGELCYHNMLNYYIWCRPCPVFWAFYFYFGLVFRPVSKMLSSRSWKIIIIVATIIMVACFFMNWVMLMDVQLVGDTFQRSMIDYAYSRPVILIFNLFMVVAIAGILTQNISIYSTILSFLGKFSLEIYLWHLFTLYYLVLRYEPLMGLVKNMPELIPIIAFFVAFLTAFLFFIIKHFLKWVKNIIFLISQRISYS